MGHASTHTLLWSHLCYALSKMKRLPPPRVRRRNIVPLLRRLENPPATVAAALPPLHPPDSALPIPLPTVSLSLTPHSHLSHYLRTHLPASFTHADLLHFLKNKLHHHPSFAHFDLAVFHWAAAVDSYRHHHSTYEWMVRALAASHRLDDLAPVLDALLAHPCPCSDASIFACPRLEPTFLLALRAYSRAGRAADAAASFDRMRLAVDGKPGVGAYNAIIHGLSKRGDHAAAVEWYRRLRGDRVKPDVSTFNILIGSYCRNSMFESALGLFKEMRRFDGCDPNVVTFNTLITSLLRDNKFEEGIGIAYEMIDLGCQFSVATCEILLNGLCRNGMVGRACDLFIDLINKRVAPSEFDSGFFTDMVCKAGLFERAVEVFDEMWESECKPGVIACTTMVEGLRSCGKVDAALGVMEKMLKEGVLPDTVTFNCLIEALCEAGKSSDADGLRVLAGKKGLVCDGATYRLLVGGFGREGRRKEGEEVVMEMLDAGFIPGIATYNKLMDGLKRGDRFARKKKTKDG